MIRIGTVNIDTSHAPSFAEFFLQGNDARYTAVYNDAFRTDAEVEAFINKFGLEKRYYDLSEMAKNVDLVFIQGCNWDRHLELALPFVEAGVPVFVDKPLAGNMKDVRAFEQLAAQGKKIIGTSAMRYTYEHDSFFAVPEDQRGNIVHISVMVGVDEFNYAIHAVESVMGFLGDVKPVSTRYIGTGIVGNTECDSYYVRFENGVTAAYHIGKKGWQPSTALVMTEKTSFAYKIDSSKVYEAMLKHVVAYMQGKPNRIATVPQMTDSVKIMLAGIKSRANGGAEALIAGLKEDDPSFDGAAFEEFYAAQQRK